MDRVTIKLAAIQSGDCKAEFVDQLCRKCWEENRASCPMVEQSLLKPITHPAR